QPGRGHLVHFARVRHVEDAEAQGEVDREGHDESRGEKRNQNQVEAAQVLVPGPGRDPALGQERDEEEQNGDLFAGHGGVAEVLRDREVERLHALEGSRERRSGTNASAYLTRSW